MESRQAGCVAIGKRGVLIEGPPGSGKSSLALAMIDRGAVLVGDDGVLLDARGDRLLARPAPRIRGLLEVRNLGLIRLPVREEAAVALVLRLDAEAPRFIETAEEVVICGITLPLIRIWPDTAIMAIKAEMALERFGLSLD